MASTLASRLREPDIVNSDSQSHEQQTQPQTGAPSIGDGATPETLLGWLENVLDVIITSSNVRSLLPRRIGIEYRVCFLGKSLARYQIAFHSVT